MSAPRAQNARGAGPDFPDPPLACFNCLVPTLADYWPPVTWKVIGSVWATAAEPSQATR